MKAMLYLPGKEEPAAVLDEVAIVTFNDNHKASPVRISFKTRKFNAGNTMTELHRHEKMQIRFEDGRVADVLLQHSSLDMEGNTIGVLRVLGEIGEAAYA
ncbi:MAG: hypothetical protein BroJett021_43770 [Chloroflexota bacterium]|jgi:hypothetical protein|nr:hypothetical protein [Caldilinea sp.]GIK75389.1 MAG: hypothetical protein BroJett021_43770 [Chloroflexota bacterium]